MKRKLILLGIFAMILIFSNTLIGCAKKYTVTFDAGEGSGTTPEKQIVPADTVIQLPEQGDMIAPTGTDFDGWSFDGRKLNNWDWDESKEFTYIGGGRVKVTGNVKFVASWVDRPNYSSIFFNSNGGTNILSIDWIEPDDIITMPNNPTRKDYVFAGWYDDITLTTPFTKTTIDKNITLYAKWIKSFESPYAGNMVLIETGDFQKLPLPWDNENLHNVRMNKDFYIGQYEITWRQYAAVMGEYPGYFVHEDSPVENVSLYDAIAFCNALSEKEGFTPAYSIYGDNVIRHPDASPLKNCCF